MKPTHRSKKAPDPAIFSEYNAALALMNPTRHSHRRESHFSINDTMVE